MRFKLHLYRTMNYDGITKTLPEPALFQNIPGTEFDNKEVTAALINCTGRGRLFKAKL